jgi:hypothetical protein
VASGAFFKPVLQTKHGVPQGNCFTACVASLLGMSITDVPEYDCDYSDADWWSKWVAWFAARGLSPELTWRAPSGYALMTVRTPMPHCVVVRNGELIWNPFHGAPLPVGTVINYYVALAPVARP